MRVDLSLGEHLRLVAVPDTGRGEQNDYLIALSGSLERTRWAATADAIRDFFVPGGSVVLDLTGIESYDPSTTADLFALRREATKIGVRFVFSGTPAASTVHLQRHVELTTS